MVAHIYLSAVYFDQNPLGRIMNRFSQDLQVRTLLQSILNLALSVHLQPCPFFLLLLSKLRKDIVHLVGHVIPLHSGGQ